MIIINICQFGFRESTSTCDAFLDVTGYLQINNDKHIYVSINNKKVFDSLEHSILLDKLYLYGFKVVILLGVTLVTNINQYVHVNSSISITSPI